MNTVPYTNARRSGRTSPGLIEIIDQADPRHPGNPEPRQPNRGDRRRRAVRRPVRLRTRRRPFVSSEASHA